MRNNVMCTLRLYDVIGITRHLPIQLKSFSKIAQPLHKEAVHGCSFLCAIAEKSVIMSEAFYLTSVSYFSVRNLYILGENTSKYCSRIIVVHVHAIAFFF